MHTTNQFPFRFDQISILGNRIIHLRLTMFNKALLFLALSLIISGASAQCFNENIQYAVSH